jgi:hypothetical protein
MSGIKMMHSVAPRRWNPHARSAAWACFTIAAILTLTNLFPQVGASAISSTGTQSGTVASPSPLFIRVQYTAGTSFAGGGYGNAFNPLNESFYVVDGAGVTEGSMGTVSVVNESTWTVRASIPVIAGEYSRMTIDPVHQLAFVAGGQAGYLSIFNATTLKMVRVFSNLYTEDVAVDPAHEIAVYSTTTELVFLNYATWTFVGNVTLSSGRLTIDTEHGIVGVSGPTTASVALLQESTRKFITNVSVVGQPLPIRYDATSGRMLVASNNGNGYSTFLDLAPGTVTNGTFATIGNVQDIAPVGGGTDEALFMSTNDVAVYGVPSNSVIGSVTLGGSFLYSIAIDPKSLVALGSDHLAGRSFPMIPTLTNLAEATFSESGLPAGTSWCVTYNASMACSTTRNIYFYEAPANYPFSVAPVTGYSATPSSGNLNMGAGGANQVIAFSIGPSSLFPVYFNETGLPPGVSWSVTLNGALQSTAVPSIVFQIVNGTYPFTVQSPVTMGSWKQYAASITSGSAIVAGSHVAKPVTYTEQFLLTTAASPAAGGTVAPATGWYQANAGFILTATPASGYVFSSWVGTGPGSYTGPNNNQGISLSASDNETAMFDTFNYTVTFTESGLAPGVQWSVTLAGDLKTSTTTTIVFSEPNGSYSYTVETPIAIGSWKEYTTPTGSGSVKVAGSNQGTTVYYSEEFLLTTAASPVAGGTVSPASGWYVAGATIELDATPALGYTFVAWTGTGPGAYNGANNPENYTLTGSNNETADLTTGNSFSVFFNETGLPLGLQWGVNLSGVLKTSITSSVVFSEPNGSYNYTTQTPISYGAWKEYSSSTGLSNIQVTGRYVTATVPYIEDFLLNTTASPSAGGTAGPISGWHVAGGIIELEAAAASGYSFSSWVGTGPGAYSGTGNPHNLSLTGSDNETAEFAGISTTTYTVQFTSTALPVGLQWEVNLSGVLKTSMTQTIDFSVVNGSYHYSVVSPILVGYWKEYVASVTSGQVTVEGAGVATSVVFGEDFRLNVTASPADTGTVGPSSGWHSADSTVTIQASAANGFVFSKWAGTGPGSYTGNSNPKSLTVTGSENETADFVVPTYAATFLCANTTSVVNWSVTIDGATTWTTFSSLSFQLPNGTYPYSIGVQSGYTATPSSGIVQIEGSSASATISIQPAGGSSQGNIFTTSVMGIPLYWLIIAIAAVLVVLVFIMYVRRREVTAAPPVAAMPAESATEGPAPSPVRPPAVPKAEWSEDGLDFQRPAGTSLPAAGNVSVSSAPPRNPNLPWAINLTPEGVEVIDETKEAEPISPSTEGTSQPWISGDQPAPRRSPPSPVDVYNVLKTLEKGPRSMAELEWRVEVFGTDRMPELLSILGKAGLVTSSKADTGIYQYDLTDRGKYVVRQKAQQDPSAHPAVSVQSMGVETSAAEPVSPPIRTEEPPASSGQALGEERLTTAETSPFGSEIKPEDVNPQLKGKELLSKEALQPLEINVQPDRGAGTRDTTVQTDSEKQAQALMEKASKARRRPRSKFGVEQEAKPSKGSGKKGED